MSSSNERSKWKRTQNPLIWKDQQGNVRDMTSNEPDDYKYGEGFRISSIIQLRTFLPRNIAGVNYTDPYRYRGNNPKTMYIDNEHMLLFLNNRIGKQAGAELCQAQEKLGLATLALPCKKLWSCSI